MSYGMSGARLDIEKPVDLAATINDFNNPIEEP